VTARWQGWLRPAAIGLGLGVCVLGLVILAIV
jgi:hypothetical protein